MKGIPAMKATTWLYLGMMLLAGCAAPHEAEDEPLDPSAELIGFMSEGELDRLVDGTAEALRESPAVRDSAKARRVAPAEWTNATDVPVQRPAEFLDRYAELLNGRIGGSVQFERRPWVTEDAAASMPSERSDLRSRLTLMPGKEGSTDERLRLRLELFEGEATSAAFAHDEEFAVATPRVAAAKRAEKLRDEKLAKPAALAKRPAAAPDLRELRYARSGIENRIALSSRRVSPLQGGGLEVAFRVVARRGIHLSVQAIFLNDAGEQVEVSRPKRYAMEEDARTVVTLRSQLPAKRYVLVFDRD